MPVPSSILELIARFEQNRETYCAGHYLETPLRREFIDPFFKALGWDTDNSSGYAEAYKDVIHEDAIRVGGTTKAPDYCFRIGCARSQKARTLTPRHIGDLRILDPACGSGSFLIQAYQYLLDWHLGWYTENDPIKWARGKSPAIYQTASGEWRLTTSQKKEILLNHKSYLRSRYRSPGR